METMKFEVPSERMGKELVLTQQMEAKYLKDFVETKILGEIKDLESAKAFSKILEEYKKESYQEESIVFRILCLKARKKVVELEGRGTIDLDLELERLEKFYSEKQRKQNPRYYSQNNGIIPSKKVGPYIRSHFAIK